MLFVPEIEVLATTEQFSNTHTLKEGASEPNTEAIEEQIWQDLMSDGYELASRTDIEDVKLYNVLLREVKNYIAVTYNYPYTETTIYTSMFKYIEEITVVNDMAITSLKGIEKIKFNELKFIHPSNKYSIPVTFVVSIIDTSIVCIFSASLNIPYKSVTLDESTVAKLLIDVQFV